MRIERRRVYGSMRIASEEYAEVCGLKRKSKRQFAHRVVTHTRHPAVFAVCFQRDGLILPEVGIE